MSAKPLITALVFTMTVTLAACSTNTDKSTDRQVAGTVHLCSSCHGLTGRSVSPEFPILAAQQSEYLETQIKAFRDHSRADPHASTYMWGMANHLDDATIAGLAQYFSSQAPVTSAKRSDPVNQAAVKIYNEGIEGREVPACLGCHGEHAEGQGAIPRLAGQHRSYLSDQLTHFRSNARNNETMHQNAINLNDGEIAALADYLSAL
jgi:cytochrome c553